MTYFSVDVETTGFFPHKYDVTSVSVVEVETEQHISFRVTEPIEGFNWDPETKLWAQANVPASVESLPEMSPYLGVKQIQKLLRKFPEPWVFVAWPCSFDYPHLQFLYLKAGYEIMPFNYRTLDIKSYMCGALGLPIEAPRELFVGYWTEPSKDEAHNPYYDALAQARTLKNLFARQERNGGFSGLV